MKLHGIIDLLFDEMINNDQNAINADSIDWVAMSEVSTDQDAIPNKLGYLYDLNELYTRNDMNTKLGSAMTMIADKLKKSKLKRKNERVTLQGEALEMSWTTLEEEGKDLEVALIQVHSLLNPTNCSFKNCCAL